MLRSRMPPIRVLCRPGSLVGRGSSSGLVRFASQSQSGGPKAPAGSNTVIIPGSASSTVTNPTPPPPGAIKPISPSSASAPGPTSTSSTVISPERVPRPPPPPPPAGVKSTISPTGSGPQGSKSSLPPPPPPPPTASPAPRRKPRRFRRFLLTLILLTGIGFGSGTYYSLISDSFHDFFTEYIPFGEDAVSYFEEREFHKRFPKAAQRVSTKPRETGEKVTIPSKSGISWKVADSKDKGSTEGQKKASGTPDKPASDKKPVSRAQEGKQHPLDATAGEKTAVVEEVKAGAKATSPKVKSTEDKQRTQSEVSKPKETKFEAKSADPESESTKARVVAAIDPLTIKDASEPVLQDLVKIINDIIAVVNADAASPSPSSNYSSAIESAKTSLADVGRKITSLKEAEKAQAEQTIKASHEDFDRAAKELVRRLEEEMLDQESRWKDDFEAEREKISQSYQSKIQTELAREKELAEQRLENELLEQAIVLKRQFASDVKAQVEAERSGRLSKLSELSSSVSELEKLTTDWTSVVDANLQTQHLHVAVEAMRAHLDDPNTNHPTPFIRELAALKEVAADDPVVHAAIASINPIAYQRGVPSSAQLIDRFRRVAAEVRKAALLPEDAGVASHAASVVLSKVLFKKSGAVAGGDDVESVLTRTETLLEEGDVDAAAREMNGLKGWAKVLSRDWLAEARRVLEVKQALDVIATEARLQSLRLD